MPPGKALVNELRQILESSTTPENLNGHAWADSLVVQQLLERDPRLRSRPAGHRLLAALAGVFREMMPSVPPRRGKRLDTQWGQFGILAALYFAPLEFGAARPTNLRDAWGRIDQALPLFVFGKRDCEVPPAELERYRLISDEVETAPTSTTSDWHVKGLERLAGLFLEREQHLSRQLERPSAILHPAPDGQPARGGAARAVAPLQQLRQRLTQFYQGHQARLWTGLAVLALLLVGFKTWRVLSLARAVQAQIGQLEGIADGELSPELVSQVGPQLTGLRRDVSALRAQVRYFLWAGPLLGWVPVYGPDLATAGDLLKMADGLAVAGDEAFQAALPLWEAVQAEGARPSIPELVAMLVAAQPRFETANQALARVVAARAEIEPARLSPRNRGRVEKLDRFLPLLEDGLAMATAAPRLLGAGGHGPQTYLLLLQNEDELRATGGFITAVGVVTLDRGEIVSFAVEDSYAIDDLDRPTFPPPWQLQRYMGAGLWWIRDSNWSAHFPTVAEWAERMYTYARLHAVDGVIALDQEAVRLLVAAAGPLQVTGVAAPITGDNLIEYMRAAKDPSQCGGLDPEARAGCKDFMQPLAEAFLSRMEGGDLDWLALARAARDMLDQRHVLLQMDDETAAAAVAGRGWDGALRPNPGDFLMVVDSNLGYNKVNAVVESELTYEVDLTQPDAPQATLTVLHRNPNPAGSATGCVHAVPDYGADDEYADLIAGCYWDYLRVYTLAGAELLEATPQFIPGAELITGEPAPAQVDDLSAGFMPERIEGVGGFGTMLLVPMGESLETSFRYALPAEVVSADRATRSYRLYVQKQPGTLGHPFTLRVRLPPDATVVSSQPEGAVRAGEWQAEFTLLTDMSVVIVFRAS